MVPIIESNSYVFLQNPLPQTECSVLLASELWNIFRLRQLWVMDPEDSITEKLQKLAFSMWHILNKYYLRIQLISLKNENIHFQFPLSALHFIYIKKPKPKVIKHIKIETIYFFKSLVVMTHFMQINESDRTSLIHCSVKIYSFPLSWGKLGQASSHFSPPSLAFFFFPL